MHDYEMAMQREMAAREARWGSGECCSRNCSKQMPSIGRVEQFHLTSDALEEFFNSQVC